MTSSDEADYAEALLDGLEPIPDWLRDEVDWEPEWMRNPPEWLQEGWEPEWMRAPLPDWLRDIFEDDEPENPTVEPDKPKASPPPGLKATAVRAFRMAQNGGSHTHAEWRALCASYGHLCLCCMQKHELTRDHVIPVLLGGRDDIANLQPLCRSCNSHKGAKHIDYRPACTYLDLIARVRAAHAHNPQFSRAELARETGWSEPMIRKVLKEIQGV